MKIEIMVDMITAPATDPRIAPTKAPLLMLDLFDETKSPT